jgi:hypothetical protein
VTAKRSRDVPEYSWAENGHFIIPADAHHPVQLFLVS